MTQPAPQLALYAFPHCPHCTRVTNAIARLEVEVEYRDILAEEEHAAALLAATGRQRVPVLRVIHEGGDDEWLSESGAIVRWLFEHHGREGVARVSVSEVFLGVPTTLTMWGLLFVGIVFPELQSPAWLAACLVAAGRSAVAFRGSRAWWHAMIGGVFTLASASIALRWAGFADLPWWWAAYAAVAVLAIATLIMRVRLGLKRRDDGHAEGPTASSPG